MKRTLLLFLHLLAPAGVGYAPTPNSLPVIYSDPLSSTSFTVPLIFGLIIFFFYWFFSWLFRPGNRPELEQDYRAALASGDVIRAWQAGYAYYAHLHKGKVTLDDEKAIYNDLLTIL